MLAHNQRLPLRSLEQEGSHHQRRRIPGGGSLEEIDSRDDDVYANWKRRVDDLWSVYLPRLEGSDFVHGGLVNLWRAMQDARERRAGAE